MSNYITLLGAEQVQSAASSMQSAASQMQSAASSIDWSMQQNQRFMDDWLQRFSEVVDRLTAAATSAPAANGTKETA